MSAENKLRSTPGRWWPRFSIRLLLVITAVVGGFLVLRQRSVSQHAAAERLVSKGVKFRFDLVGKGQSRFSKLDHLIAMPKLQEAQLYQAKMTSEDFARLKAARPDVNVLGGYEKCFHQPPGASHRL